MMDFQEIQKRREQLAEGPVFAIPEAKVADLAKALLTEGILTKYGARAFTCMAHSDEDLATTLGALERCVGMMQEQR